jgi:hypothetical protein
VTPDEFITRYPRLWHMAELGSWPTIEAHGLRSTTALLDLFEVTGSEREALEACHRRESVTIIHSDYGQAVVRDQKPIIPLVLGRVLTDMSAEEWYRTLNRRVFFWVNERRLEKMLKAPPYRGRPHSVLVIDTAEMLARHMPDITLSPINSGATHPSGSGMRGSHTFRSFDDYPWEERRTAAEKVVELAVDYRVPDVAPLLIDIETRQAPAQTV